MIQEIRVAPTLYDVRGKALLEEIKRTLHIDSLTSVRAVKVYRFEGINEKSAVALAQHSLVDPMSQTCLCNKPFCNSTGVTVEVGNKPGVMNPEVASLFKAANALGIDDLIAADSSWEYHFEGTLSHKELQLILDRLLVNKTVAHVITETPKSLVIKGSTRDVATIPFGQMSDEQCAEFAKAHQLFLNDAELAAIKDYFLALGRDPYDGELETIAQTWSEHCCHKTFKAPLTINGKKKEPLYTRLKRAAKKFNTETISAFEDNAGVFRFYDGYAIAGKVETHNSPSALEPYGGAATGSGGVFRDIMGTGQGAKVIASTDMFCVAPSDTKQEDIPPGCLHPAYLLRNIVAGVRDYGNRMGIPTNNGSVHFHFDFRAKPTVIVGAYGILPESRSQKGVPQIGDRIIVVGGKTGRDGIHGATFSSDAMTHQTSTVSATAVQIGNPIEQKRVADMLLVARDENLIRAITDCGAGGFSSAIGEMAQQLGAHVELANAPIKYMGLAPWEIWVSESQERMVCAIEPEKVKQFMQLCQDYNVEPADIGYFTGTKKLLVRYSGQTVCDLDMQFLHEGCPIPELKGDRTQKKVTQNKGFLPPKNEKEWIERLCSVLAHGNVCSKEPIVRQYDHTVQGTNALQSYAGAHQNGPQDAAVLAPLLGKPYSLIISHGMNPILNRLDPYAGSVWAITEALANLVAVGGNPQDAALIDNFIWPKPQGEFLWALDQSMEACIDAMNAFKLPFISGKDSLSSTYRYPDGTALHIPPVLCISAFGKIPDVQKTISSDLKKAGSLLVLVGNVDTDATGGSVYEQVMNGESSCVPQIDMGKTAECFKQLHTLIAQGRIHSCHDVSEGGIISAVAEMCFGGDMGAQLIASALHSKRADYALFNETAGCFIVEVSPNDYAQGMFNDIEHTVIGQTTSVKSLIVLHDEEILLNVELERLVRAWQRPIKELFNT